MAIDEPDQIVPAQDADEPDQIADEPSFVAAWVEEIQTASDEEKDWRKDADDATQAYRGKRDNSQHSFNIYHANIETIVPALYNSTPSPDVRRRFADPDVTGKTVADIIERSLSYGVDSYDFDSVMSASVFDMCVAGRGVARVKYEPLFSEDGSVADERLISEYVPWRSFRRGPGRTWADVGWISFEHFLSKETIEQHAPECVDELPFNYSAATKEEKPSKQETLPRFSKRARVFEIWDKDSRRVDFISPDYGKRRLWTVPDPLGLQDFFPVPRPMLATNTTDGLIPIAPYSIYKELLEELNEVSRRISRMVKQIRARGWYAGLSDDIKNAVEAGDGELTPLSGAEGAVMGAGAPGLDKMISWFPLEPIVLALKQLVEQREIIKQTIYEVTKIADVMRGATNPNETLGAQQLKAQWGSLSVQRMQAEVARFARDLFRLKTEILASKFDMVSLQRMTGINLPPLAEKQQAIQRIQMAQQPQMDPATGQPAPAQPPSPQDIDLAQGPSLEECEQLLRTDAMRGYVIDIESDSTIRGDLSRNQQNISLFLQGSAQFAQAIGPLVMQGAMPGNVATELFGAFARQFKLGKSAEDALAKWSDEAKKPMPAPPDHAAQAEQAKLQLEQQKHQDMMQFEQGKHQAMLGFEQGKHQAMMALEDRKLQQQAALDQQKTQNEIALKQADHAHERDKLSLPTREEFVSHLNNLNNILASQQDNHAALVQSQLQSQAQSAATQQAHQQMLADVANKTNAALEQIAQHMAAPAQILRDRNGRAIGIQKGQRTMAVNRGADGKVVGLQ